MIAQLERSSMRSTRFNRFAHLGHTDNPIITVSESVGKRHVSGWFAKLQQTNRSAKSIRIGYLERTFGAIDLDGPMSMLFHIETRVKTDHRACLEFQERVKMS